MSNSPPSSALITRLRSIAAAGGGLATPTGNAWLEHGLQRAQLHEVYASEQADGPAAAGFTLALALAAGALPTLWIRTEADEAQAGRLHASGLVELGLPPSSLLLVLVRDAAARLRIAADAARCAGLGTVLVESWGPAPEWDLTATRRLQLAAEASGVTVLGMRIGAAPVPSAAATRWGVSAFPSAALEADAPGLPTFQVECLRRRGGPAGARTCVEWNREDKCFEQAALAGAGVSMVAGGAAARHPPAPVRGTG